LTEKLNGKLLEKITFLSLILYGISTSLSISATNFLLGFLFIFFLINCIRKRKIFYTPEGVSMIFLFFIRGIRVISHPTAWFKFGGKFWDHLPYYLIPNLSVKKIKIIVYATLFVATLISLLGILQAFFGFNYPFLWEQPFQKREFVGLNFGFRMHSGGYYSIVAVVSLVLFCFLKENWKTKIFLFLCSALNIIAVILAQTRTYYVALGLTISLILLKKNFRWFVFGSLLVVSITLRLFQTYPVPKIRFISIFNMTKNVSNAERFWMWKTSLQIMKKHPLVGIGFENWQEEVVKYWEKEKGKYPLNWIIVAEEKQGVKEQSVLSAIRSHPHNSYLNVAVEDGLIGLILFLFFWIGNSVRAFCRAKKLLKGSLMYALNLSVGFSLLMLMIGGFFEYNLITARLLLPMTFLMGLSYLPEEG